MKLHNLTKFAAIVIAILGIIFLAGLMSSSDDDANNGWISPLIYLSYIVLVICIAIVLIYVLKNLFSNKENFKRTIISLGLFLGVILISYVLAGDEEVKANGIMHSGSTSKLVGAGLNAFYLLTLVALGTMVWAFLNKLKK
ncbi:hypothetical protein LXD69_06675 [Flavobacterium sediminilitoris]|uniref:MotA/TolQ/ExbB proton channel family protein n=1 Tax=Flavobacterium sediminilitoris TaxID=2024526 RepID=A0ABY4HTY5_9FLAO|nr:MULTISPECIES: hypothetical protein [Flavobacterium]UOX35194.1 hypothetical protein LXD69_06675 [Flavobacterium sediminilitoris]